MTPPAHIPKDNITEHLSAEVVIIGAGHAGSCAARAAAEAGAKVVVIEQQDEVHQWILGIGEMGYMNSEWHKARGIPEVDIDTFVNDWQLRNANRSNYRLIRTYAEQCGSCFDWLIAPLSEEEKAQIHPMMTPLSPNMPETQNGIHAWGGTPNLGMKLMQKTVKETQRIARELGAVFLFDTRAEQLTTEESAAAAKPLPSVSDRTLPEAYNKLLFCSAQHHSKAVTGVIARTADGHYLEVTASKGVLLAAGDYSKNKEMCEDLLAECADLIDEGDWSGHGWDGSGIRMGVWAGGRLEPRPHSSAGGNYSFPGFDTIGSTACLRLNTHGKRYSNEGFGNHVLAALAGARQPNGMLWSIFDSNILDEVTFQAPCNASFDYTAPERIRRFEESLAEARSSRGRLVMNKDQAGDKRPLCCADTLEELAEAIYPDPKDRENMLEAVRRYNLLCDQGHDPDFGKEPALLHPIRKAPFYASGQYKNSRYPLGQSMKILVTTGGLLTDEFQNVLDDDFEPIKGLYASGNCCGGRFGLHYATSLPGQSISMAQTLGREAGRHIAALPG